MSLQLEIVTPQQKFIEEDSVDSVTLPGTEGELGILPEHIPLLTSLASGVLSYQSGNERKALAIHGGYAQVENNRVTVLAELAERAEDIDVSRAQDAEKRALKTLSGKFGSDETEQQRLEKHEAKLKRALVRQTATRI
ncbi:MAG: F0F1 ATP synthase subunit epsilon [SAR324 cluster bacterium]|nr:F0F1 ATP synthase subunit epsilon [SAR324 cluster bacterium]